MQTGFLRARIVLLALCLSFQLLVPLSSPGLVIADPSQIEALGLVSLGEDGAAWLRWGNRDFLVGPGYMIGRDLRVVSIRPDCVMLFRPLARTYHALAPKTPEVAFKDRTHTIWCTPLPLWKVIRMIAFAYRKDCICHAETRAEVAPRRHVENLDDLLERAVNPHHRYHGRQGIIYVSPVHVQGTAWKEFNEQVRRFNSRALVQWFSVLGNKGTLVSDGKDLSVVLETIGRQLRVPITWQGPVKIPLYCSFRDRPWHEILENILLFNGFGLSPSREGLTVVQGWK
jgi:hypothetical protein